MAVPKRKTSHARKSSRRSTVWKLNAPTLVICPNCGEYKVAHRACGNCGMYNGRQVIVKLTRTNYGTNIMGGRILYALLFCSDTLNFS